MPLLSSISYFGLPEAQPAPFFPLFPALSAYAASSEEEPSSAASCLLACLPACWLLLLIAAYLKGNDFDPFFS